MELGPDSLPQGARIVISSSTINTGLAYSLYASELHGISSLSEGRVCITLGVAKEWKPYACYLSFRKKLAAPVTVCFLLHRGFAERAPLAAAGHAALRTPSQ